MKDDNNNKRDPFIIRIESCLRHGLNQKALDLAMARLERSPGDAVSRMALCRILMHMGRIDEAKETLQELEDMLFELSRVYAFMGDINLRRGLKEEAASFYRKSMYLNRDSLIGDDVKDRISTYAFARQEVIIPDDGGERDDDRGEEIGSIAPDFRTATLAEMYIKQGHLEIAAQILKDILKRDPNNLSAIAKLQQIGYEISNGRKEISNQNSIKLKAELEKWLINIGRLRNHATRVG